MMDMKYFKTSIESALCHVYVDRRIAELTGFDVNELDDFIKERSKAFYEATKDKSLIEMTEVVENLTRLSHERAEALK